MRTAALLLPLAGCGYTFGTLGSAPAVQLVVFDNLTERRGHEFELSRRLARELAAHGTRVSAAADRRLEGAILEVREPVLAEGPADQVLVSGFYARVRYRLLDVGTGRVLREGVVEGHSESTSLRGKPPSAAREEVWAALARDIVWRLGASW